MRIATQSRFSPSCTKNRLIERIRHPDIVPLEFSELRAGDATLWEWRHGRAFLSALREGDDPSREGRCFTRSDRLAPPNVSGFEALFLTGGQSRDKILRREMRDFPCTVVFAEDPVFGGARGGIDLLKTRGLEGWVADLGQTQLKLATPQRSWTFLRDWTRLRAAGTVPPPEIPTQRRRLREFIALKLRLAMKEGAHRPRALVFALPARMTDDGTPGGCSYAGMRGDRMLLPDALELAGLADLRLFVLNDAELAALSARLDPRLARFGKVLVLTLGFGIGAALIHRDIGTMQLHARKSRK